LSAPSLSIARNASFSQEMQTSPMRRCTNVVSEARAPPEVFGFGVMTLTPGRARSL
jgi:hypothetical protein